MEYIFWALFGVGFIILIISLLVEKFKKYKVAAIILTVVFFLAAIIERYTIQGCPDIEVTAFLGF